MIWFAMERLQLSKINRTDIKELYKRSALEEDGLIIVDKPTLVFDKDTGQYVFGLFQVPRDPSELLNVLNNIKFQTTRRTGGMLSTSRIFGHSPRIAMRQDFCNKTSLAQEDPKGHDVVCSYVSVLEDIYKEFAGKAYESHKKQTDEVLQERRIKDSIFTSGIINKNNPLKYHYDAGNFKDCYSCMITLKDGVEGGYLMIPEYNVCVKTFHNSLFMFDGQKILHGVSPISRRHDKAYRYTLVYYSLKGMWQCLNPYEEVKRVQKRKTDLYIKRKNELKAKQNPTR